MRTTASKSKLTNKADDLAFLLYDDQPATDGNDHIFVCYIIIIEIVIIKIVIIEIAIITLNCEGVLQFGDLQRSICIG